MKHLKLLLAAGCALGALAAPAAAQQITVTQPYVTVVASCGTQAYDPAAAAQPLTQDISGNLCISFATLPLPPGAATSSNQGLILTALNTIIAQAVPSCTATSAVSSSAESSRVLKNNPGILCAVTAVNFTATAGYLAVVNLAAAPAPGAAITPLDCKVLPASGDATILFGTGFGSVYSVGITALVTSAANCFTYTTGTITAYLSGKVI